MWINLCSGKRSISLTFTDFLICVGLVRLKTENVFYTPHHKTKLHGWVERYFFIIFPFPKARKQDCCKTDEKYKSMKQKTLLAITSKNVRNVRYLKLYSYLLHWEHKEHSSYLEYNYEINVVY